MCGISRSQSRNGLKGTARALSHRREPPKSGVRPVRGDQPFRLSSPLAPILRATSAPVKGANCQR